MIREHEDWYVPCVFIYEDLADQFLGAIRALWRRDHAFIYWSLR